jgi:hypothetical protein
MKHRKIERRKIFKRNHCFISFHATKESWLEFSDYFRARAELKRLKLNYPEGYPNWGDGRASKDVLFDYPSHISLCFLEGG